METTRRFARSLSEAFPDERACSVTRFKRPRANLVDRLCWVLSVALLASLFFMPDMVRAVAP